MNLRGRYERDSLKMEVDTEIPNCILRFGTRGTSLQN